MNLYVQGEVDALTIIFSRILIDRPFDIYTFYNIFNIRTKNIQIIENSLRSSLYASISTCLELGVSSTNFNVAIKCSFKSIMHEYSIDLEPVWIASMIIQEKWRKVICDPSYLMCRRRLNYELNELNSF
jgi:hypothetical protein